jgi:hypothetical protein
MRLAQMHNATAGSAGSALERFPESLLGMNLISFYAINWKTQNGVPADPAMALREVWNV